MHGRHTLLLVAGVALFSLTHWSCQRRPVLVDTLGTLIDNGHFSYWNDPRKLAPFIIVASVDENRVVAKHVEAARYAGLYLDLHQVRCKRENSLRGSLPDPEVTFYYFADGRYPDSKPNPRYKQLFKADPGRRYLFFLTRDRDVLRSIGDVGDYSIPVATGTRPEATTQDEDIGKRISEILLTPAKGADFDMMAGMVSAYSRIADVWDSRLHAVQLLRRLTALSEPIRSQACGVLVESYYGQEDCLSEIVEDARESVENRQTASRLLKEKNTHLQRVIASLKDPASQAYLDYAGDSRRRIREELQTLLFSSNPTLRERTCTALKRYYPYDVDPRCAEAKGGPAGHQIQGR